MAEAKRNMLTTAFVLPAELRDLLRSAAAARSLANPSRRISMSDVAREILESRRGDLEEEVRRVLGPGALPERPSDTTAKKPARRRGAA